MSVVAWVRHLPDLRVDMAQRLGCTVARLQRRLGSRQVEVAALEAVPRAACRLADKQDKRLWPAAYREDVADSQRRPFSAAPCLRRLRHRARRWVAATIAQATGQASGSADALVNTA